MDGEREKKRGGEKKRGIKKEGKNRLLFSIFANRKKEGKGKRKGPFLLFYGPRKEKKKKRVERRGQVILLQLLPST